MCFSWRTKLGEVWVGEAGQSGAQGPAPQGSFQQGHVLPLGFLCHLPDHPQRTFWLSQDFLCRPSVGKSYGLCWLLCFRHRKPCQVAASWVWPSHWSAGPQVGQPLLLARISSGSTKGRGSRRGSAVCWEGPRLRGIRGAGSLQVLHLQWEMLLHANPGHTCASLVFFGETEQVGESGLHPPPLG